MQNLSLPAIIIQLNFDCPSVLAELLATNLVFFCTQLITIVMVMVAFKLKKGFFEESGKVKQVAADDGWSSSFIDKSSENSSFTERSEKVVLVK